MKTQEALNARTAIAPPFQSRESPLLPTHGLPLTTIVFGYLESHLQASRHCIQCAATRTAAVWIPSSCPVREREKHLVVAEKRGGGGKKKKRLEIIFPGILWRTDLGMRVVKAFCLAYSFLVWQLISPTAQKHLTGLAEVNSSFICPSCSWSGEWQSCFSSVWMLFSLLLPLSRAVVWSLGKPVSFLPTAFSPGSGQHPSALAPAPYSCELPLLKPFAPKPAAGWQGPSSFPSTPFPVIFSLLLLQLARLFAALLTSCFCFPGTLLFQPPLTPWAIATTGLLRCSFWDTTPFLCSVSCPPKLLSIHLPGAEMSCSFKRPLASSVDWLDLRWLWPCLTCHIVASQWGDTPDVNQPQTPQWLRKPGSHHSSAGEE